MNAAQLSHPTSSILSLKNIQILCQGQALPHCHSLPWTLIVACVSLTIAGLLPLKWWPCSPSPPNKLLLHYLACLQFMFSLHSPKPSILWAQPRPCPSHDTYSHPSVWAVKCLAHTFGCQCLPKPSWCACLISPAQLKASRDQWLYLSYLSISPIPRTISIYLATQNVLIEWKECSYCVCLQFRNLIIWTSWNLKSCVPQTRLLSSMNLGPGFLFLHIPHGSWSNTWAVVNAQWAFLLLLRSRDVNWKDPSDWSKTTYVL